MNFIIALRAMSFKIQAFYHWSPASLPLPSCLVHHRIFILTASSDKFLKEHMMNEHDEREFVCDICDSTIRGRRKMKKHKQSHKEVICN